MLTTFTVFQSKFKELGIKTTVKIDSRGYSLLTISTTADVDYINDFAITNKLPILTRKWGPNE